MTSVDAKSKRRSLRLAEWPVLDDRALVKEQRTQFRQRKRAVEAYARGETLARIAREWGIHGYTVQRLAHRALQAHPDGRLWGYRALAPHVRVQAYERSKAPRVLVHGKAGNAGAFAQLLQRHPGLAAQLRRELEAGNVTLQPGEPGRLTGVKGAAARFHQACRELGLGAGDYPLNQQDMAIRSLGRTLRAWMQDDFDLAARAAGTRIKPASALRQLPERGASDAFDTVEFDAHKMDVRLKVIDRDPLGGEQSYETERVWLLAIIDVATRCILGYTLSTKRECSRFEAIATFRRAVTPASAPQLTLPGLSLLRSGGFVSQALEQTRYACWRQIRLDNARAHLAATSLDVVCEALGCAADFGPVYQPDDRPFIERFFGTVTATLSRRLPGALAGRGAAQTALKRLRDPKDTLRLIVTTQELEELLDLTVWNYHGTPHAGLGGFTPLEMMQRHVLGIGREPVRLRLIPQPLRECPELLHDPVLCRVHGNLGRGERPYITFFNVRYTSEWLAQRSGLIGQRLRIHYDENDLRRVRASTQDGQVLEDLLASGAWRHEPHSLWVRQEVFRAKRRRQLEFGTGDNPIEAFLALRRMDAAKRRRSASDIAQVQRERKTASAKAKARVNPTPPSSVEPTAVPALSQLVTGPVKAKRLRIEPGYTR
ncbi:Mu transposase C-terminal domain-containing protein [Variovorax sp. J22R133]|uniref:Mu transposase C-terminal domain-containing protein n=1 Tax=Variovorax brevis TaxID=3053503 RepID=UPI002576C105|nr:Mu transposase C-terminal domain-containing protein [Variovorax sp. J22R133]MDM0116815.1 Mu transposase C-terminal domain-containing protein [Variovorax sp. J22R133]